MSTKWMRWLPAALVPAVVVTAAIAIPATAGAAPTLPEKSADEVLAMIADSTDVAFSGTIEQRSELGLPDIPTEPGSANAVTGGLEFLAGSHTFRAFVLDSDSVRLQVLDDMAERDVIVNGEEVWFYDFSTNEAVQITVPEGTATDARRGTATHPGYAGPRTPAEVADYLIDAIEPSTSVSVATTALVAGRPAYQLSLDPRSTQTLVDEVVLSVDSETGMPLRVEVSAVGQDEPAMSLGFSAIDFAAPDAALFDFTPPTGADVTTKAIDPSMFEHGVAEHPARTESSDDAMSGMPDAMQVVERAPTVFGAGWDAVVEIPAPDPGALTAGSEADAPDAEGASETEDAQRMLDQLTTAVDGGRVVSTALISVLITDDGRVFAGAVPVERLQAAAAGALGQ